MGMMYVEAIMKRLFFIQNIPAEQPALREERGEARSGGPVAWTARGHPEGSPSRRRGCRHPLHVSRSSRWRIFFLRWRRRARVDFLESGALIPFPSAKGISILYLLRGQSSVGAVRFLQALRGFDGCRFPKEAGSLLLLLLSPRLIVTARGLVGFLQGNGNCSSGS